MWASRAACGSAQRVPPSAWAAHHLPCRAARNAIKCCVEGRRMAGLRRDTGEMQNTVAAIYRYPVKGLSAEALDRVTLAPGDCLPQDRRFAIALPSTRF